MPTAMGFKKMSNNEKLRIYFKHGGKITRDGFEKPLPPTDDETSIRFFSLALLLFSTRGLKLLRTTHKKFLSSEIDQFGQKTGSKPEKNTKKER